jgi:hypothetical protein
MSSIGACLDLLIATYKRLKRFKAVGFVRASKVQPTVLIRLVRY